ncbi:MAG TPA: M17 family peptidase N-terminal domain-containing protein, partial [Pedococcus sp.]
MTTLTASDRPAHDLKVDAVVLGAHSADGAAALAAGHGLPDDVAAHLTGALAALGAKGSADEVVKVASVPGVTAPVVVVTGLGDAPADGVPGHEVLRRAAGAATRAL